jgi:hypothetical protein
MTTLQTLEVSEAQLGALVGRSDRTIRRWIKDGHLQRVAPGRLLLVDALPVVVGLIEEAGDGSELAQERLKKITAERKLVELELARQRGLLASIQDFEDVQSRSYGMVQHGCMQLPARLAIRLLNEGDEATFKQVVRQEVTLVLTAAAAEIKQANQRLRTGKPMNEQNAADDEN